MLNVGAYYLGSGRCHFTVWAPQRKQIDVKIISPSGRVLPMIPDERGYWFLNATDIEPGTRYVYQLDGQLERPDPASKFQPEGMHGPSEVVDSFFDWSDRDWVGIPLSDYIIYELHIGTFTPEGTFDAAIDRLDRLKALGITAIEIMPVAQFPGDRNWGYDGVYPYAVQNSYGGPNGFKRLVDACHQQGIAVLLDVVYNHLGPEGNYLPDFAPYLTARYKSPWGDTINFDDAYSDGVRSYFIENALYWIENFHIDALRLDAIHGIYDLGAYHFLEDLVERVEALSQQIGRKIYITAESDLNDVRVIRPKIQGGYGIDAQWCDDFHHALHALLTNETNDYYQDFGRCSDLQKAFKEGFVYSGQYSKARKRSHGNSSQAEAGDCFIVSAQNHDQVGNRPFAERLAQLTTSEGLKLAAGAMLLSPYIPLLFMGEEYGEVSPFYYFIDHSDPALKAAIKQSKTDELLNAGFVGEAQDPSAVETFAQSKLHWDWQYEADRSVLWQFYQQLIHLCKTHSALKRLDKTCLDVSGCEVDKLIFIHRYCERCDENSQVFYAMNFSNRAVPFEAKPPAGTWQKLLDSAEVKWKGPGSSLPETLVPLETITLPAHSFVLYQA
jgi:maltooligosyltrehalose trehalohydrolase